METVKQENQLQVIVRESGLEQSKAKFILENFQNYFEIADEWAKKAKVIVVRDASQKADMDMARVGRLFLREKRIAIENSRKALKEQALREGKAIDGIANVLKALIVPIEEYLEQQEKFVEIQEEKKRESKRLEIEKRMEEERLAEEKRIAEEQEKMRKENDRLKREAAIKEKALQIERAKAEEERKKQESILAEQRAKAEEEKRVIEEKAKKEHEAIEKKARDEHQKAETARKEAEEKSRIEREKLEKQKAVAEDKVRKEKEKAREEAEKARKEKERLEAMLKNQIECPKCHYKFQDGRNKK